MNNDSKNCLDIFWETPIPDFQIPKIEEQREVIFVFKKNMPGIVWNTLSTLENNPATLPQTETILQGYSVNGISIDELLQVKNYGAACKFLIEMIKNQSFSLNEQTACTLHGILGKEEALEWGVFRKHQVHINNVTFIPPVPDSLCNIAEKGFVYLKSIQDPKQRAFITFLWMSRNQFFYDCNKRTASLMLNGELLSNNYYPFSILETKRDEFNTNLSEFYNTGNATVILRFFSKICTELYMNIENKPQKPKHHRMR